MWLRQPPTPRPGEVGQRGVGERWVVVAGRPRPQISGKTNMPENFIRSAVFYSAVSKVLDIFYLN